MAIFNTVYGGKTKTQTYDFTVSDYGFSFVDTTGAYGRTDGQGFYHYNNPSSAAQGGALSFPSSVYTGTLKNVHLRIYYPNRQHGIGLMKGSYTAFIRYYKAENVNAIGNDNTSYSMSQHIGEVELDFNFDGTSKLTGTVGGDSFSIDHSSVSTLYSAWSDKTMRIICDAWRTSAAAYIRKISITTE